MALDGTYTGLQASVLSWTGRSDTRLTGLIPDAIVLFEAVANRRLRVRQQEATTDLTTTAGTVALPADYLLWRRVTWTGDVNNDLDYMVPSALRRKFPVVNQGVPNAFSIEGVNLLTRDYDDTTSVIELEYYKLIPALSGGANWLFSAHPDAYLFGTLCEVYGSMRQADEMALWGSRRNDVFDEIERLDAKTRGNSAIVVAGATP